MTADHLRSGQLRVVAHGLYEFEKGVRSLMLFTMCRTCARIVTEKLERRGIGYMLQAVGTERVNLYFGRQECLDAVSGFIHKPLNLLTPEEDFMLGAMLGYDIHVQCRRFCERKGIAAAGAGKL